MRLRVLSAAVSTLPKPMHLIAPSQFFFALDKDPIDLHSVHPFKISIQSLWDTPVGLWYLDSHDESSWGLGMKILEEYTLPSAFN